MTFSKAWLKGMESEIKTINNVITSTLRGSGKLVLISGENSHERNTMINFTQDVLKLKAEIFSCFIKGEDFDSYSSVLKHLLNECNARYPDVYKKISNMQSFNLRSAAKSINKIANTLILDVLELIAEEHPLVLLIDEVDFYGPKSLDLLKEFSCFIPYNRFTIICTLKNAWNTELITQFKLDDFIQHIALTPSDSLEITDSYHIASLFNKFGFAPDNINFIIKLFLRCNVQLMNNNIAQIYGLMQYLNDDDSLNYYDAMSCYIILLLRNGQKCDALILARQLNRKLTKKLKKPESDDINETKAMRCFILGNYYFYANKGRAAVSILKKGLAYMDNDIFCEYQNTIGCAYMSIGDWENAEISYLKAYEASVNEGTFLPHLHINLIQLYTFKCEFNRASYYYKALKDVKFQFKNDFTETLLNLLFMPISEAIGDRENMNISYEMLVNKLLNRSYWVTIPLYHISYLRLYIIAGDHLFRCKDYKNSMKLYEKALINYDDEINEPYMKDFINVRIMACRSMLGFKAGRFIMDLNLNYKTKSRFHKYMLCSMFFFAYFVFLSSGDSIKARKCLIRCIRYARVSGNLIYKSMGYYELYKLYSSVNCKKTKLYYRKYLEAASAMGISPNNIPYTYIDAIKRDDGRISTIIDFVKNNYKKDISLSMLSDEVHLSETHICHLMKEKTGYTFKELLLQTRIQEARIMLTGTVLNIADIAAAVGFSSSKYFCEVFKEMCGFTPNSYRKKHHNHNIKEFVR